MHRKKACRAVVTYSLNSNMHAKPFLWITFLLQLEGLKLCKHAYVSTQVYKHSWSSLFKTFKNEVLTLARPANLSRRGIGVTCDLGVKFFLRNNVKGENLIFGWENCLWHCYHPPCCYAYVPSGILTRLSQIYTKRFSIFDKIFPNLLKKST